MKFLFVDDDTRLLSSLRECFEDFPNVFFAECHSVEEALVAIHEKKPDVLFLDHSLTPDRGSEGLVIARRVVGVKIYSFSSWLRPAEEEEYKALGIQMLSKGDDPQELMSIITG